MVTHGDRILDFVRRFPGRDDDEIARALGIQPRQTVNLNCRRLQRRGYLERRTGPNGKVCNYPPGSVPRATEHSIASREAVPLIAGRPALTLEKLLASGFSLSAEWTLDTAGRIRATQPLPKPRGVYAFVVDGRAHYVGVATMGIAKRLYFYGRPGVTQRTSQRLNALLADALAAGRPVSIYTAHPPALTWNDLPVSGDAGLELGLIETYDLPWNQRGVR